MADLQFIDFALIPGRVRKENQFRLLEDFSSIVNNYSPKWRWLAVDIYRAAKRRGKYPTLGKITGGIKGFFGLIKASIL